MSYTQRQDARSYDSITTFDSPVAHSYYLMGSAVISTVVIWGLKETAFTELK